MAFEEDVAAAFTFIRRAPHACEPVTHVRLKNVRRRLLQRLSYHVYYSVDDERAIVTVLAFWHTSRRPPRL